MDDDHGHDDDDEGTGAKCGSCIAGSLHAAHGKASHLMHLIMLTSIHAMGYYDYDDYTGDDDHGHDIGGGGGDDDAMDN